MNVMVIGLGSMGKRRIRLINQYDKSVNIYGVDNCEERCTDAKKIFGITCYHTVEESFENVQFDAAFVCTSPLSHSGIILTLLDLGVHVFTEINLVADNYDKILKKCREKEKLVFLSSTFLYRKDITYIIERVKNKRVNYQYHSGQYLPDWHPWENYKDFFVANQKSNGCREILALELPWIIKCFGPVKRIFTMKDKMSELDLRYDDNYLLMIEHENGNKGQIIIDVVARRARRNLEIYGEKLQLFWEGHPDSLREYDINKKMLNNVVTYAQIEKDMNYCENIIENAYFDEIAVFFNQIVGDQQMIIQHDLSTDKKVLELIDEIES